MPSAPDKLRELTELCEERTKLYGSDHVRLGRVLSALWPGGITLQSGTDFARFAYMMLIMTKVCRYTTRFNSGHQDSVDDLVVYGAILASIDQGFFDEKPT